jgi:hypothetical protein
MDEKDLETLFPESYCNTPPNDENLTIKEGLY